MRLSFAKMTGAGNDFVMLDNRDGVLSIDRDSIARLCDRHFGIGADGLMLVEAGGDGGAEFVMRYFNADGGEAEMCGNGARCFARFARMLEGEPGAPVAFQTRAGLVRAEFDGELVTVDLTPPQGLRIKGWIQTRHGGSFELHDCNTGVPHAVVFVEDADKAMVSELGREIRFHPNYQPAGTNVNFVQILGPDAIRVRTYERGVEDETLACGTGVAASAIVAHLARGVALPVRVRVQGGDELQVSFQSDGESVTGVRLKGPAALVFTGEIEV
ncbi:MAG TPA: diaminopimelate epimerase [Verrucomicrobiae bacterium]|nr:diaminopimelate epimerase [Verrucomicrobiae bacterium]